MAVADKRKPKPPGFVGFREVLSRLSVVWALDNASLSADLQVGRREIVCVLRRCVRLGWVVCLRAPGRGNRAQPGIFAITPAGRERLADPCGRTERGGRRDAGGTAGKMPALRGGVGRRDAGGTAGGTPALRVRRAGETPALRG